MGVPKELTERMNSYDAGYLAGSKDASIVILEIKKQLDSLIEVAVRRGEYEALVRARQILRRLK